MTRRLRALKSGTPSTDQNPVDEQGHLTDDKTFEDLMSELTADDSWQAVKNEETEINDLINDAKIAVSAAKAQQRDVDAATDKTTDNVEAESSIKDDGTAPVKSQEEDEFEEEAEEYLAQVLAEIKSVPFTTKNLTDSSTGNEDLRKDLPPSYSEVTVDDELASRFANLGLPSVPTTIGTAAKTKTKTVAKGYTDDDIDSWCIICNEDATLSCKGCDNDLYCTNCWLEGHKGPDAGADERKHKAVQYIKDMGKEKSLVGA